MATERGPRGRKGKQGAQGERGPLGHGGARGGRGPAGPAGPTTSRAEILAAVEEELAGIRKHLEIQLTRFGQLQVQLDRIEKLLKQVGHAS